MGNSTTQGLTRAQGLFYKVKPKSAKTEKKEKNRQLRHFNKNNLVGSKNRRIFAVIQKMKFNLKLGNMDRENKETALLKVFQSLCKSCDDMDFVAKDLTDEKKDLLNAINDTVFDARPVVAEVLIQDKKDDLLLEQLQKEYQIVLDFLSENRLMAKFIEHKSKYSDE